MQTGAAPWHSPNGFGVVCLEIMAKFSGNWHDKAVNTKKVLPVWMVGRTLHFVPCGADSFDKHGPAVVLLERVRRSIAFCGLNKLCGFVGATYWEHSWPGEGRRAELQRKFILIAF